VLTAVVLPPNTWQRGSVLRLLLVESLWAKALGGGRDACFHKEKANDETAPMGIANR